MEEREGVSGNRCSYFKIFVRSIHDRHYVVSIFILLIFILLYTISTVTHTVTVTVTVKYTVPKY